MNCKNCGATIDENAKFCENCGTPIDKPLDSFYDKIVPTREPIAKTTPTPSTSITHEEEKSFWKKKYPEMTKTEQNKVKTFFGVIFGVLAVALIIIIMVATVPASAPNTGNNSDAESDKFTYLNEALTINKISYTVTSIENVKKIGNDYLGATTTNNFVLIHILISNNSNDTYTANPLNFKLLKNDTNGKTLEYEYNSNTFYLDNGMSLGEVSPQLTKSFSILYETLTPTTSENYGLQCSDGLFGSKSIISLRNRP